MLGDFPGCPKFHHYEWETDNWSKLLCLWPGRQLVYYDDLLCPSLSVANSATEAAAQKKRIRHVFFDWEKRLWRRWKEKQARRLSLSSKFILFQSSFLTSIVPHSFSVIINGVARLIINLRQRQHELQLTAEKGPDSTLSTHLFEVSLSKP